MQKALESVGDRPYVLGVDAMKGNEMVTIDITCGEDEIALALWPLLRGQDYAALVSRADSEFAELYFDDNEIPETGPNDLFACVCRRGFLTEDTDAEMASRLAQQLVAQF